MTKADKRNADENGKAWADWARASEQGGYPSRFPLDDPRVFLFYFPPFPKKPWQEIDDNFRRKAPLLLSPEMLFKGKLHEWLLLASKEFPEQMKAQKEIQALMGRPMEEAELATSVRRDVEQHILAPALIEYSEGNKLGLVGKVPAGFSWGRTEAQTCVEGFCREEVKFVINLARPVGEILDAFKHWLESPDRGPRKQFRDHSVTNAREHLKKLGALRIVESGMSPEHACDNNPKTGGKFCMLYDNPEEYRRAKMRANKVLKNLFPYANT